MNDWSYLSIEVTSPFAPLYANADSDNQDGYNTIIGKPITLKGNASGGQKPYSFNWDLGDGNSSNEQNPTHSYESEGNYSLILTVIDNKGNTATDIATITVINDQETDVIIKNIRANLGSIKATIITSNIQVNWSIHIDGRVFRSNETFGTIPANSRERVKLPFKLGFGYGNVTITANSLVEVRRAFMLGPFITLYK
jgi:PKD repeat protein